MDERLIELENMLITVFPARLQKDKVTFKQFKEYKEENIIEFNLKDIKGLIHKYYVLFKDKKFILKTNQTEEVFKKEKDLIKFLEKSILK